MIFFALLSYIHDAYLPCNYRIHQVKGLVDLLQTNVETGIVGGDDEFAKRRNAFGSNTYPVKKGRTFLV